MKWTLGWIGIFGSSMVEAKVRTLSNDTNSIYIIILKVYYK